MPRVLVVDDVPENLYLLRTLLVGNGYEVVTAGNGEEALRVAKETRPDLIISDILMPVMDGFTLCRRWRADDQLHPLPFVFCTATYTDPKDEKLALSLGADLFVTKPFEPASFVQLIGGLLSRRAQGQRSQPSPPAPPEATFMRQYNAALIRKLEDKLTELEEANRALALKDRAIRSSMSGIALVDAAGRLTDVNQAFADLFGQTPAELLGTSARALAADEGSVAAISAALRERGHWAGRLEVKRKDASRFLIEAAVHVAEGTPAQPRAVMASCLDVTERRRLEEAAERAQRLDALGLFAGGVAHDVNNLLTGLYGNIEVAAAALPPDSPARAPLQTALRVYERARDLTGHLLTFASGCPPRKGPVHLPALLEECFALCLSGSAIEARLTSAEGLPAVEADAGQLTQVFNNILLNARQAMGDHGRLRVSAEAASGWVRISCRDEGPGIAPEHLARVLEPFFTTKAEGHGLGLATSRSIVESFGGRIEIDSKPGEGTTVTVHLPAAPGTEARPTPELLSRPARGAGRILLMDDEAAVRRSAQILLTLCGYDVVSAANGEEAIALFRRALDAGKGFDVSILDLTVRGGLGGEETAVALHALAPDAVLLLSSGYPEHMLAARARSSGFSAVIPKPYRQHELQSAIEAVIARPKASDGLPMVRPDA